MVLQLHLYQKKVIDEVKDDNAIIKMPTGSGKTFVAAEIIRCRLKQSSNKKAIFFVPTVELVDQQAKAIEMWLQNQNVARYHGSLSPPDMSMFRILVSTPSAFLALQSNKNFLNWDSCCVCVFDEVHHVLKRHPYRTIAFEMKKYVQLNIKNMQIIGLSASLTYAVNDKATQKALESICFDLCIHKMCTPTSKDLIDGGYTPKNDSCEIINCVDHLIGVLPNYARQPHLMHQTFLKRVSKREASEFALLLWDTVSLMESHATKLVPHFNSPIKRPQLASWAEYASKLRTKNALYNDFFHKLEGVYVALKLLVVTWEEEVQLTLYLLQIYRLFEESSTFSLALQQSISSIAQFSTINLRIGKLKVLQEQLIEKKKRFGNSFRCIVFAQQRISAYILACYINNTPELDGMKAEFVTATGSKTTPSISISPSQSRTALNNFRNGTINILVATSVAEEGLDVAAANVVISYNHMKDSVELCQRSGRARQIDCAIVVLEERHDRPVAMLREVEIQQENIIRKFDPSCINNQNVTTKMIDSQRQRTLQANKLLNTNNSTQHNCAAALNLYCQKTKANLSIKDKFINNLFVTELIYTSVTDSVSAIGTASNKKFSKEDGAKKLLQKLKERNVGR